MRKHSRKQLAQGQLLAQGTCARNSRKGSRKQSAQNLFLIESDENQYLIPVVEPFIERIDHKKKSIYFDLPEGLLDL